MSHWINLRKTLHIIRNTREMKSNLLKIKLALKLKQIDIVGTTNSISIDNNVPNIHCIISYRIAFTLHIIIIVYARMAHIGDKYTLYGEHWEAPALSFITPLGELSGLTRSKLPTRTKTLQSVARYARCWCLIRLMAQPRRPYFIRTYPVPPEGLSIRLHDGPLYDLTVDFGEMLWNTEPHIHTHTPPTNHPSNNIVQYQPQ